MKKGNLNRKKNWISQRVSVSYSPFLSTISFPVSTGDKIWETRACRPGQFKRDVLPLEMVYIVQKILHGTTGIVPSISSSPIPIPPSLFSIQCCLANDCNNQSVAPRAFAHSCSISFHYPYYKADFTPSPEYLPLYSLPWVCLYKSRFRK